MGRVAGWAVGLLMNCTLWRLGWSQRPGWYYGGLEAPFGKTLDASQMPAGFTLNAQALLWYSYWVIISMLVVIAVSSVGLCLQQFLRAQQVRPDGREDEGGAPPRPRGIYWLAQSATLASAWPGSPVQKGLGRWRDSQAQPAIAHASRTLGPPGGWGAPALKEWGKGILSSLSGWDAVQTCKKLAAHPSPCLVPLLGTGVHQAPVAGFAVLHSMQSRLAELPAS